MCGIFGMANFKNLRTNAMLQRIILKNLTLNSKVRGKDATGYAFIGKEGITIFKHHVFADKFLELPNYNSVLRDGIPHRRNKFGKPYSIIGHTRHKTKGSFLNNLNNHPIRTGSIIGVHNGHISNDDSLFSELIRTSNGKVSRKAEVDSEIIFSLVDYFSKKHKNPATENKNLIGNIKNPTTEAIKETCSLLIGSFVCALVDADNPKALWIFRGASDALTVNIYEEEGLIIFASAESFIEKSIPFIRRLSEPNTLSIESYSGICINIEERTYTSFSFKKNNKIGF